MTIFCVLKLFIPGEIFTNILSFNDDVSSIVFHLESKEKLDADWRKSFVFYLQTLASVCF